MSRDSVLRPFDSGLHLQINYAGELNEQQLAAVTAPPGPALVIAGAGSGKTRTLTYRVAYLLEQGIPPERILLLTFTNKAAREMMRRVADLLGQEVPALWGGTFHSIANRVLRQHAVLLGFERDFSILDREDARHLIATCVAESGIDAKARGLPKPDVLSEIFSLAVNTHKSLPEILDEQYGQFSHLAVEVGDIQQRYGTRKRESNVMDFDDLLVLWVRLLEEHPDVRELYQRRFQFILVDEYQDTNRLQSDLIDLLGARHHNVMVVGDDAQSIYAWRGANFQNILRFPDRYPNSRLYRIETNYRSTPEILHVANAAIGANLYQFSKQLTPARKSGGKPSLVPCRDAVGQAKFVAERVLELRAEGISLNRMAVLYRSHFHALELQLELNRYHIPFLITSGIRFLEQAHVKDVTAYLKLITNPRDELSFKRLVKLLPGIGAKAAEKLWADFAETADAKSASTGGARLRPSPVLHPGDPSIPGAQQHNQTAHRSGSPGEAPDSDAPPLAVRLQACAGGVPKKAAAAWAQFVATIAQLEGKGVRGHAAAMIQLVLEAQYEDYLKDNYDNYVSRVEDLEQLAIFARQFDSLEEFLTQVALLTSLDAEDEQAAKDDEEKLRLSTVHQAKGLEFDVVFVLMLCDGLFPSARSLESPEGEEEERRLFYVAITRARNELYLTYPLIRAGYGLSGDLTQHPSRFLDEIPEDLLDQWDLRLYG